MHRAEKEYLTIKENGQNYYVLELNDIPEAGTIIRLRVEQATQLNNIVRTELVETLRFNDSVRFVDNMSASFTDALGTSKEYMRFHDPVYAIAYETYGRLKDVVGDDFQGFDRHGFGTLGFDNGTYGNPMFGGIVYQSEFSDVQNRPATGFIIKVVQNDVIRPVILEKVAEYDPCWVRDVVNVTFVETPLPKISIPVKVLDDATITVIDSDVYASVSDNSDDVIQTTIGESLTISIREVGMDSINLDITGFGSEFDGPPPNP